jgi:small-conductance mechanosensitive channel
VFAGLLVAAMIALPGFAPGQLVNLLGISSVAFGFAFRDILQNFLAGILLLIAEPFRINDQIRSGDFEGTVEDIQTRATFIRTYDGRRIVIPNSTLFVNPVTVNTAFDKRRLEQDFTFPVDVDVDSRKRLLLGALEGVNDVLDEPAPDAVIADITESVMKIRLRWWIAPPSQYELRNGLDAVLARVAAALARERADAKRDAEQGRHAGLQPAAAGRGDRER